MAKLAFYSTCMSGNEAQNNRHGFILYCRRNRKKAPFPVGLYGIKNNYSSCHYICNKNRLCSVTCGIDMSVILKAHMGVDVLLEFEGEKSSKVEMVP